MELYIVSVGCLKDMIDKTVADFQSLSVILNNVAQAPSNVSLPVVPVEKAIDLTVQFKPRLVKRLIKSKESFLTGMTLNLKHFKSNLFRPNFLEILNRKKPPKVGTPLINKRFLEFIHEKLLKYDFEYRHVNRYKSIMLKEKQEISLIFRIDLINIFRLYDEISRLITSHKMKMINNSRQMDKIVFIGQTNKIAKTQNTISFKFIHQLISNIGLNNSIRPNMLEWLSTVNISKEKQTVLPIIEKTLPPISLRKYASIKADDAGHAFEYFNFPLLEATQPFDFIQTQCFEVEQFLCVEDVSLNRSSISSDTECNILDKTIEISDSESEITNFSQNKPLSLDSRKDSTISIEEMPVILSQIQENVQVEIVEENLNAEPNLENNQIELEQANVELDKPQENQSLNQIRDESEIATVSTNNKKKKDDTIFINFVPIKHVNPIMEIPSPELFSQSMLKRLKRNDSNENSIMSTSIESTGSTRRKPTKRRIYKLGLSKKQPIRNHLHPANRHTN